MMGIVAAIEREFASHGKPVWNDSADGRWQDDEVLEFKHLLRAPWESIDDNSLHRVSSTLPLFDADLLWRILPAFLRMTLHDQTGLWLNVFNEIAPPWKKAGGPTLKLPLSELTQVHRMSLPP